MRVTDEMVDAAIREWALHTGVEAVPFQMRPTLEAALAAAPQAEPVAWAQKAALDGVREYGEIIATLYADGYQPEQEWTEPLYTVPPAPAVPEGMVLVPAWKGYALLGTGMYAINHSAPPADPQLGAELFITFATDEEKSGNRQVGETRDNPPDAPPRQPEEMVIRIGFLNERGVFALEEQLRLLREAHGWSTARQPAPDARVCTCHPDDQPPQPCPRRFALAECRAAAAPDNKLRDRCGCGEPLTLGVVHRKDAPCYVADAPDALREAARMALREMERAAPLLELYPDDYGEAINALREALGDEK